MIDLLAVQIGDTVEYKNYQCSASLEQERFTGTYQGFDFWAPDERPAELWIELIKHQEPMHGKLIRVRATQVTNIWPGLAGKEESHD
jgi:hypothetical protein